MSRMMVLIGVPASGKSTFRELWMNRVAENSMEDQYVIVSSDDEIENQARIHGLTYNQVFERPEIRELAFDAADAKFHQALQDRKFIILDRTNMSRKSRAAYIKFAKSKRNQYAVDSVVFERPATNVEHDEWNHRLANRPGKTIPNHILVEMFCNYQEPTKEEGFDSFTRINTFKE